MDRPEVSTEESTAGHQMMRRGLDVHRNNLYMPWQRNIGPADHYPTVRFAEAGLRHIPERQHRENVEDLTRRFAALSLNDGSVMTVVRNISIFRTDR